MTKHKVVTHEIVRIVSVDGQWYIETKSRILLRFPFTTDNLPNELKDEPYILKVWFSKNQFRDYPIHKVELLPKRNAHLPAGKGEGYVAVYEEGSKSELVKQLMKEAVSS